MTFKESGDKERGRGKSSFALTGLSRRVSVSMVLLFQLLFFNSVVAQVTIGGSVYGGGNKAAGTVTGTVKVEVKAGSVAGNVYGGGNLAAVNGATVVTIDSVALVNKSVFGGGHAAGVSGSATVTVGAGTVGGSGEASAYGVYGGCDSAGSVGGAIAVNIGGGSLGTSLLGIFGGGYGAKTTTAGNVTVTIGDTNGHKVPVLYTDIYGGSALGSVNLSTSNTTKVDFLNGTLHGNLYGGGLGQADVINGNDTTKYDTLGSVNGTVQVNVGTADQDANNCFITFDGSSIYGCNNMGGSPKGNVDVHIYKTAHTSENDTTQTNTAYAIANVFGGGRNAHYTSSGSGRATVTVHSCDNTIGRVFGGGDAADAYGVAVEIFGGRYGDVFGGGNGEAKPASIGNGGTNTNVHGGYINRLFGGSNKQGTIAGNMRTVVDTAGSCQERIVEFFGGSNEVDITGDVVTTIACGTVFDTIYGGSNMADIGGEVKLIVNGGSIGTVFGGSKGVEGDDASAVIDSNVMVELHGGNIDYVFGGNNHGGNIRGVITVTVDSTLEDCPLTIVHNVYGGGNQAPAYASDGELISPRVYVRQGTVGGSVFGGGRGQGARVRSNPMVYVGKEIGLTPDPSPSGEGSEGPVVVGNVYGGADASRVFGHTAVLMTGGTVRGNLFGACKGVRRGESPTMTEITTHGIVDGWTTVDLAGGTVEGNVYGGGEMGSVGHYAATWSKYESGSDADKGKYGTTYVTVSGGTVGVEAAGQSVDMKGNVFGGGLGLAKVPDNEMGGTFADPVSDEDYLLAMGMVARAVVTIRDSVADGSTVSTPYIVGSVYGGGDNGRVSDSTLVTVSGGTIGKPLTLAERYVDADAQITRIYTGNVYGGGSGATRIGTRHVDAKDVDVPVYRETAGRVDGNTRVLVSGGTVRHNIYGGGNMASVGVFTTSEAGVASYTSGGTATVTINGTALIGPKKDDLTKDAEGNALRAGQIDTNFMYLGSNEGTVFGSCRGLSGGALKNFAFTKVSHVTIGGDAQVLNVFGGGENGHVQDSTLVRISGGVIGGIPIHGTSHTVDGGEYDGVTLTLAVADDESAEDDFGEGRFVTRGLVFGGGKGFDFIPWFLEQKNLKKFCYTAGRVYGNANVTISDSAKIYNDVFGGGVISSVGTFVYGDSDNENHVTGVVTGTGTSTVTIHGGEIGTSGLNNGDVYGGGRGLPGEYTQASTPEMRQVPDEAYVGNANVIVDGGTIHGNVYGGAASGHVQGDAHVTITDGIIGTAGLGGWHSNVYGGGGGTSRYTMASGQKKHSLTAGRVFGDTYVNVTGGTIYHNVYGGGAIASVGTYDLSGVANPLLSGGHAYVTVTGGTIGTDGHDNGMVFGSGRGEVTYSFFDSLAYAANTVVTIGKQGAATGPKVNGSVYGSGENGHVFQKATVNIHSGTIGCTAEEYAKYEADATTYADSLANFPFRGNVYGAGCGTDLTPEGKYNPLAGIVQGVTEVNVSGGYISHNVYGGGAMASVGYITGTTVHNDADASFALSWPAALTFADSTGSASVNITGGHIGTAAAPAASGDVYGASRGEAGDRYAFATLANVRNANVNVDFTPSEGNVIVGSVYGSGENGHVYDSTIVTLNNGLVGGSLFGGGKGSDKYTDQLKNPSTDTLYDVEVYDITAGKVYGNTHVVMNGGRVAGSVYGGGNLASVGKGNYKGYGEGAHVSADDSLLAESSGHCYVTILGGIIGPDSILAGTVYNNTYSVPDGNVYGAGKGIVFPDAEKVGFDYNRNYYVAYVNKSFVVIGDSTQRSCDLSIQYPHVTANVFGGGENGHVRFDTYVQTNSGIVGVRPLATGVKSDDGHWANRGNVWGAGRGEDKNADGTYCQSAGSVTRNTTIDILGARIYRNVQAGGAMASVGPVKGYTGDPSTCVINVRLPLADDTIGGGKNTNNAFGGYIGGGSRGIPSPDGTDNSHLATCHNSQINIYRGRVKNTLYGGGENGQMLGNTEINVYGGYIRSAIYGGGKGSWKATEAETYMAGDFSNDTLSGFIHGNTTVNLLGGEVPFTYGGCRRASVGGNVTINIGEDKGDGTYSGDASFIVGKDKVYGGNQYAGSPKGDITVNVYSTAHGVDPAHNKYPSNVTDSASLVRNDSIQTYAIAAVYGGSYNSNYLPRAGHSATVHVYGCENTIKELYGGGAAADVGDSIVNANTNLIIEGGRFQKVFGGGDGTIDRYLGEQIPANIYGVATTQIHSGLITEFFGGSNQMGNVKTISTQIDHDTTRCAEVIGNLYSGSNESDIFGDGELIIACGAGEFSEVYGGSNNAQIHGNVTLTIRGGTIGTVFGGSKGRLDDPTTIDTNESFAANIDGNVTLNLEGGTIGEAFGGSNINGAIHGIITVNVLDTCQDCPLKVENVYGAGNITPYTPDSVVVAGVKQTPASPLVNIKHTAKSTTLTGSVYGGGFGAGAVVTANPVVTIGDTSHADTALVGTNVFGGGSFAEVKGNTTVLIQNPNTRVSGAIYGGGALADVRSTNVTLNSGTVGGDIYGGGLGRKADDNVSAIAAKVNGDVQVTVNGGKAANIYGANNINGAPTGAVRVDIYGTDLPASGYALNNVFGGGNQAPYDSIPMVTVHNCNNKIAYVYGGGNAASVKGTNVTIYGGDTVGNVYGGCFGADVTQYGTQVTVHGGTLGSVFGGNNASGDITGAIRVDVNKEAEGEGEACAMHISRVYGGGNRAASQAGQITIGCTGGEDEGIDTVYGGANQANIAGKIELDITGGHINNLFGGNNRSGNITDSITINIDWAGSCSHNYLGNVYGAGNLAQYKPADSTAIFSPVVNLLNGTVSGNVYGGGLGDTNDTKSGLVNSNPIVNIGDTVKAHAAKTVHVEGNVLGGGSLAQVTGNTQVNVFKGTVDSSVYGGGEGYERDPIFALVMKNATVSMRAGRVKGSVYGGGKVASVGCYSYDANNAKALPDSCKSGTGHTAVRISGGTVGPDVLRMPAFTGHVFGGGKGRVADPVANPKIGGLAFSNTTEVEVSDSAFIKGSVYGGSESGHVLDSTYVKIQGGQIGSGFNYAADTNYGPYTEWDVASLAECHHWPFESTNYAYDPYADRYDARGGSRSATDGHTYYGNVFGGGSGVFPYQPEGRTDTAVWSRTAGAVYGNTRVEVSGGHILTSLYGGNEMTDVGTYDDELRCTRGTGTASVIMIGGTLGVPRTLDSIAAHPVTCYLFGGGKGDPRTFFNTRTNVDSAYVRVAGGRIYGSVFGGGEDGHVVRHVSLNIDSAAYIGTEGLSYVDGNVFGAGRGFSGDALTAGSVGGNVVVTIKGGTMLGNVYGGGRLASVGTQFAAPNQSDYGSMQEGRDHGFVTINIGGDAVVGTDAVFGDSRPEHLFTGNVYGGSMGRLTLVDGTVNPLWPDIAKVKNTEINIADSAVVRASVYGGSELGSVTGNTLIRITGDKVKVGTVKRDGSGTVLYRFGSVLGGGYGTDRTDSIRGIPSNHLAGRVWGSTEVDIYEGSVANNVFGGGKLASVGDSAVSTSGNTLVNIGNVSQSSNSVVIGNSVYGANDEAGSPLGNSEVHIYHTAHGTTPATNLCPTGITTAEQLAEGADTQAYAIAAVYGGGNLAPHTPTDTVDGTTLVHVHHCDNTIRNLFGGGNAAATRNNHLIVDGGRIHRLFGGGNGEVSAANVYGTATSEVYGGLIDTVFGGSNVDGRIGSVSLLIDTAGGTGCDHIIGTLFGGSNYAPGGGGTLTIACSDYVFDEVYGGSNLAPIDGDVTLTIQGGTYSNVFAGSKGNDTTASDITGNVTLNLHGGSIANAFGGSNVGGNIGGIITVNVLDTSTHCELQLTNLYGASNLAVYTPDDTTAFSPVVNLLNGTVSGNVYGGGKGIEISVGTDGSNSGSGREKGHAHANPQVNIGDDVDTHDVWIQGNVYGGGALAYVYGNTEVNITGDTNRVRIGHGLTDAERADFVALATDSLKNAWMQNWDANNPGGNVFAAGQGYVGDSLAANVTGTATLNIRGGHIWKNAYGGAEMASVGVFTTDSDGNHNIADGTGKTIVRVIGGIVGKRKADYATITYADGNVYGAGLGRAGARYSFYNYVNNTDVTIDSTAQVRGSVFGGAENGHVWRNTSVKIKGGEIGTRLTAAEEAEDDDGAGVNIYTGNVYGGGRGIDEINVSEHTHSLTAGRVFGNTYVEVTGGLIHHDVFGGGSLASVGDTIHDVTGGIAYDIMGNATSGTYTFDTSLNGTPDSTRAYQAGDPVSGTGLAHVRILGGRIGHTGHNEGSVFGSGRGLAGDASHSEYYHLAYAHNTRVFIGDTTISGKRREPDIRGSVFGGGANGHVTQNAHVKMTAGVVGGKTASDYSPEALDTMTVDTTVCGIPYYSGIAASDTLTDHYGRGHATFLGNVYGGGRGVDHNANDGLSRFAGRVFGNAKVEISGGMVYHSVFGGGSMSSVGFYHGGSSMSTMMADPGTGKAIVRVSGGRIGTNGRNNGRVFGSSRGRAGSSYSFMAFVNTTDVTISDSARVRGSVFGSGENGHVLDSTLVKVEGGIIGHGMRRGSDRWVNEYIGNVYGGGRGVDLDFSGSASKTAGWVRHSTHVIVSGGHIHHNVYGGGSLASVGQDTSVGYNNTFGLTDRTGRTWVDITGGTIGILVDAADSSQNLYGNVFGAGRGNAGVGIEHGNDWSLMTYVSNAVVNINYDTAAISTAAILAEPTATTQHITGNVFGGGNNGHVNNSTSVTVTRGLIGSAGNKGYGSLEGNVFGGGRGEDTYKTYLVGNDGTYLTNGGSSSGVTYNRHDRSAVNTYYESPRTHADSLAVTDSLSVAAGIVYGNTSVNINAATANDVLVRHHVYGGGSMSSVGHYATATSQNGEGYDSGEIYLLTPGTGTTSVTITGGTLGTKGINNGMVFGASRGDIGAPGSVYDSVAYVNNTIVTIGASGEASSLSNPLIHGSVYGGGENGHTVGNTSVTIHGGSIGNHAAMYERVKSLDDLSNPTAEQTAEMNRILDSLAYCGNVYGGGCGTDKYVDASDGNKEKYNPFAGVVFGNASVTMDGGYVERNIYGGGAMANLGRRQGDIVYHTNDDTCFALSWPAEIHCRPGTGVATITVTGTARVGYSGKDNGDIFGASRGEAGDRYAMVRYANVDSTSVLINIDSSATNYYNTNPKTDHTTPLVAGSVYGGAENGHVIRSTSTTLASGIVGHALYGGGKGKGTYQSQLHKISTPITEPADSTAEIFSLTAGRVYGNTYVTMTGGKVVRNIFGGGNMASVGKGNYSGGPGDYRSAGYGERWTDDNLYLRDTLANTGHAYVTVTGGTVGILDPANPKNSLKDDLPLGNVFGGCRGESAPNVSPMLLPRYAYAPAFFSGYVNHAHVVIGSDGSGEGPRLYGSVYGGGQDGHVRGETSVIVHGGEIGVPYEDSATAMAVVGVSDPENIHWVARGNVYGAGSGIGKYSSGGVSNYSTSSGSVTDSTKVLLLGGTIHRNVYGGGSLASIGPLVLPGNPHPGPDTSKSVVILRGGQVDGSVYGAGRGMESNDYPDFCNVWHSFVTIAGGQVDVDVYGGAQNGHVLGDTRVNISGGTVGVGGTSQLDGNVFGGGQGSGEERHEDDGDGGTDTLFDIFVTAGRVAGNTYVDMTGGTLHGSIFGGGRLALTGVDDAGAFIDSLHGNATITVSGNTLIEGTDTTYTTIIGTDNIDSLLRCDWSVGDIFGSGKGDIDYYNDVLAGRVTNVSITISGTPIIRGGIFGGGEMAGIGWWDNTGTFYAGTGASVVTINGGTIGSARELTYDMPVHEAFDQRVGNENPGEWTIYDDDGTIIHTCTGNVFGGSQGDIDTECPHWVSMGRSRTATVTINGGSILGGVYGGSEQGIVTGNTAVTINGGTIGIIVNPGTANEYYYGDVYAAGYGCDDPDEWDDNTPNDSTAGSAGMGIGWNPGLLAGRTFGNASVDVLGGTIYGSVYGGGSFASVGDDKPGYTVNGNTLVNIGSPTEGNATIYGDVFGANNYRGTPYGNTEVNIYHVAHVGNNFYPDTTALKALTAPTNKLTGTDIEEQTRLGQQGYALRAVYGGGNKASHEPIDTVDGTTRVRVYYCDENTVHTVYGGGNAANTRNNSVIIDGGRIYRVFGGGNGYSETGNHDDPDAPHYNPGADVLGTASTHVNAGLIDQVYGGSNQLGNIAHVDLSVTHDSGDCIEVINESFGGGNEAPSGGGEVVIKCGTYLENFYAGANAARLGSADNPVKLKVDIQGGNIGNFFGGCKGTEDEPADIYGDITVNYHGGRIVNLFGGSDVNGNISGTITVNVDVYPDFCKCADGLQLDRIYGGGRDAAYTPYDPFRGSPTVNIKNNRYRSGDDRADHQYTAADSSWIDISAVFGGGLGSTAVCTSYPRVVVGGFPDTTCVEDGQTISYKRFARIHGNVYGGGEAAPVVGNTLVIIRNATIGEDINDVTLNSGMVYGGGLGATAKITGETFVGIYGQSDIKNNVYGGGNAGIVTGSTELQLAYQQQVFPPEFIAFLDADDGGKLKGKFVSTTPNVRFSYTKDGSEPPVPATAATLWDNVPFEFGWNDTVQCIAYLWDDANNKIDSSMIPSLTAFDKATMPIISIDGNNVTLNGSVGARIRYTLDGSEPTHESTIYGNIGETPETGATGPFTIADNQVVRAISEMRGCYTSSVSSLVCDAPTVTIEGTTCTITGPAGSTLTYTTDLSTPVSNMAGATRHGTYVNSNTVTFTIPSGNDLTIKAVAQKPGYLPSLIGAAVYRP